MALLPNSRWPTHQYSVSEHGGFDPASFLCRCGHSAVQHGATGTCRFGTAHGGCGAAGFSMSGGANGA